MRINKSLITYIPASGAGSGTVTSVALSAPTGFTVSGSPVTSAGTLALAFTTGYGIPPLMTGNSGKFLTTNGTTMSWVNISGTDVTGAALTEVDDTNVTMVLGGTPNTALLRSVSMTLGWAGQLAVSRGGTGAATLTGVLIGNGTSAVTAVVGGPNQILRRNSTGTAYEFFTASFLTNPMTLNYDMIYQSGGVPARLPANTTTTKQFLSSVGNGTDATSLAWSALATTDIPSAALTKVDDTNVTLTLGGTPATSLIRAVSLTLGWSGTLAVGRGGTGASTLTGVLVGNGTSAFTAVVGTAGQFLRRNLANTAYEFRTLQGGDIAGSELTFANDTNVTMTLGGTPASALLQPVSINLGWTGQLSVSRGGTGASTLTGVLIGNGTSAVTAITGTAGQILRRNTGNTAYEFWTANYMVNPMSLEGSIIYATTGGSPAELFANSTSTRKYLSQINGTAPTWEALPASVGGSGTTNYVSKWTASTTLGNSQIYDNGTNVSIGTPAPAYKFVVSNNNTVGMEFDPGTIVTGRNRFFSYNRTTSAYVDLEILANNLILSPTINVGIGISSPAYKLDIEGTDLLVQRIRSTTNTGAAVFLAQNDLSNQYEAGIFGSTRTAVGAVASGNAYTGSSTQAFVVFGNLIKFATGSGITEQMRLTNAGDFGIGTQTPVSKLDVAGSVNITSASYLTWGGAYGANIPTISGTSGSGSNGFLQFYPAGSTSGVKMALVRTGQLKLPSYTSSSAFTGTSVATLAVDAAGDVITIAPQQTTASGTYTPTWTGLANVDSVNAFSCQYMRVGDTVTVSGWVTINATVDNTATSLSFSLPINSDTSVVNRLNGTGVQQGGGVAACLSGYGTNFGEFEVLPSVDTSVNYSFHFTYRIV